MAGSQNSSYSVESVDAIVYRDGLVHVKMELSVNTTEPSLTIELLSSSVANVLAVDQSAMPLDYALSPPNLTVYSLGASEVILEYDTLALTKKEGLVWMLVLDTPYGLRATFPENSSIIAINRPPDRIQVRSNSPVLTLSSGQWEISYVIETPIATSSITNTPSSTSGLIQAPSETLPFSWLLTVAVAVVAAAAGFMGFRHFRSGARLQGLTNQDREMLRIVSSSGGRILEAELREKLGMPKATAWRRVKKLERLGLIRVRRVGLQNEIELTS